MMHFRITHTTHYHYSEMVALSYNQARLLPRPCMYQNLLSTKLVLNPLAADYRIHEDFFGNQVAYFSIQQPHQEFSVTAISEVQLLDKANPIKFSAPISWESVRNLLNQPFSDALLDARQYTLDSPYITTNSELAAYALPSFSPGRSLVEAVNDLMQRIYTDFIFDPHFTDIATPLEKVLLHRRGVCQDFAHLAIGCLRTIGLAARYVSGYIETSPPPGQIKLTARMPLTPGLPFFCRISAG